MSQLQDQALVADIETTVRAIPGVTAIFRTGSIAGKVVDTGARILRIQDDSTPLVQFEWSPEGPRVEVAIGVHASAGAVATSSRVHAAIGALCAEQHVTPTEIHVTVVHVDDTTPSKGTPR